MTVVLPMQFQMMDHKFRPYNLSSLAPPPDVYKICWAPSDIFQQVDGKRYRRIFFNVEYQLKEIQDIAEIRKLLTAENMNDLFTDAIILKNYIAGKWNYKKCIERLKNVHELHNSLELTQYTEATKKGLERGFVYTYGYDKEFCPVVYARPDLIDFKDEQFLNPLYCLMYVVQRYRMVPYHAEKYLLIIDLNNMNVSDIPYMKIYKIMHNVSCLYTGFIKKVLVLNSSKIGMVWTVVKQFIPERAKKNIVFVKDYQEMNEYIDASQREMKYDGILPDLMTFWPPHSTVPESMRGGVTRESLSKSYIEMKERERVEEEMDDNMEYYSIENNEELFYKLTEMEQMKEEKKCHCKCSLI